MSLLDLKRHRRILVASELWLCIAQLARSKSELAADCRTEGAAQAVAALLKCNAAGDAPIDRDCDNPALTRLLILPELSLSWDDWASVDAAVKAYRRSIIVIAGVGFTKAADIRRVVTFLNDSVSDDRNVNFGCAWIQLAETGEHPAVSEVNYYCKNFPEQSGEAPLFDPVLGTEHVVFTFDDCAIAPVICADLLADTQPAKRNAIDKLRDHRLNTGVPLVVAASVLQDKPWHSIWSSRIDRVVDGNLILALANFSHTNRPTSYADDANRNLSGAYAGTGLIASKSPQSVVCNGRDNNTSKGVVLRDSCPMFVAGVLRVSDFSATTGRHLWTARWAQQYIHPSFEPAATRLQFEIPRLCRRARHLHPSENEPITEVTDHLSTAADSRKVGFFRSIADGPLAARRDPDPTSEHASNSAAETALAVTDALVRTSFLQWPSDENATVEVNISAPDGQGIFTSACYTWKSPAETWTTMASKLQEYAQSSTPRPAIVVFAEDRNGVEVRPDDVCSDHDSTTPRTTSGDFDAASPRPSSNSVILVPMGEAKRLSGEVTKQASFEVHANAIRTSIIKATGLLEV